LQLAFFVHRLAPELSFSLMNRRAPAPAVSSSAPAVSSSGDLQIKIFADGADLDSIIELARRPQIAGFTTNPTLMRQSGVTDYEGFARKLLEHIPDRPISFEVFADEPKGMARQARLLASWGENVYVKIPVTDTQGESCGPLIRGLSEDGLKLNVTAILSLDQVRTVAEALEPSPAAVVSVFAGRIADTGLDPVPLMRDALKVLAPHPALELLWASPREILNVVQADAIGCHVITVTHPLLAKLDGIGRDLEAVSLDTVRMFHGDAQQSGFIL
jgi:transaldolase